MRAVLYCLTLSRSLGPLQSLLILPLQMYIFPANTYINEPSEPQARTSNSVRHNPSIDGAAA